MLYDNLLTSLRESAPSMGSEGAQRALSTTLETIGYLLPRELVCELAMELPLSCAASLREGLQASEAARRLGHAHGACVPSELSPVTLTEIQTVCGVLFNVLPLELVRSVDAALPSPLTGVFTRYAVSVARLSKAVSATDSLRTANHQES